MNFVDLGVANLINHWYVSLCIVKAVLSAEPTAQPSACPMSHLQCKNGRCVTLNKYCDGINNCGDGTDEPKHCTPCNRTYYGEVGKTYDLELHRPKVDRLPYFCKLTLTAGGGRFGDIVQVTLERFTLGKFTSFTTAGCPDGYLTLEEKSRPSVGGVWCGTSWGPVLYFSETPSITMSLVLLTLSSDQQNGYNFDFRILYKMLPKKDASIRYGPVTTKAPDLNLSEELDSVESSYSNSSTESYYLGNRIGMTYCSRMFSDCDEKDCRLQSPNFPGVYPRNMTCYYAVRQQTVPVGKHALISVFQPEGQMVNIRSQSALYARPTQSSNPQLSTLKVWKECEEVQDYVTIYDGYTTRDPVLLKFCGGGSGVPRAVSSGPEILVEFSTSPFGTFLYPPPPNAVHGFQLQVKVDFVERELPMYTRNKKCEFWLSGTGHGVLESPRNSLPPNTTCLYHLWGSESKTSPPLPKQYARPPRYRVWLSILKYHVSKPLFLSKKQDSECSTSLKIWDGVRKPDLGDMPSKSKVPLIANFCKEQLPRSCDHQLLRNMSRPCQASESYLSTGEQATVELIMTEATALRPVMFRALYEFVDLHQDGEQWGEGKCSRIFTYPEYFLPPIVYATPQNFGSPRNIFFYGRGGSPNISCVYRFEAPKGERVRLTITNLRTGNRSDCETHNEGGWGRLQCIGHPTAYIQFWELRFSQVPYPRTVMKLPKDCLCSNSDPQLPFVYTSNSHILELKFTVDNMTVLDDYRNMGFEGTWEFIKRPGCPRSKRLRGPSGEIAFVAPSKTIEEENCEGHPWVIEPSESHYLYVKMPGVVVGGVGKTGIIRRGQCITSNRVEIHAGTTHVIVCPEPTARHSESIVEVFSEGWRITNEAERLPPVWAKHDRKEIRNVLVEFVPREEGTYAVTWLELTRRRSEDAALGLVADCVHRCPELDACINASLWCDGTDNCPSGYDESIRHCLPLPPVQFALLLIIVLIISSLCLTIVCRVRRRRRNSSRVLKSLPSDTDTIMSSSIGKEVIC
ncbi:CUB [Nesidiocoris tenuis]|uniref:CUB n=1 Tax=Nesidiocoris tenuis TaxID=355587 RepID=A0ABN7B2U0_9HEMI|nr:CUB [Nesidiocoris tenuis]